jgi:hypothetical protein
MKIIDSESLNASGYLELAMCGMRIKRSSSPCTQLIKHHAMKTQLGVVVSLHHS